MKEKLPKKTLTRKKTHHLVIYYPLVIKPSQYLNKPAVRWTRGTWNLTPLWVYPCLSISSCSVFLHMQLNKQQGPYFTRDCKGFCNLQVLSFCILRTQTNRIVSEIPQKVDLPSNAPLCAFHFHSLPTEFNFTSLIQQTQK